MAMRGNLPAVFSPGFKFNPQQAPVKKKALAQPVSTKPSDSPFGQSRMKMGKATAAMPPLPKLPSVNPKPVAAKNYKATTRRPKTGMK